MHNKKRLASATLVVLSSLAMVFGNTGLALAQAGSDGNDIDLAALDQDIDQIRARLIRLRAEIDRSQFEPDARLDHLDFDAATICDFVRTDIAFQPYEGALRGVSGALRSSAGNSLDQSILLASMLKSAGFDARVARGRLDEAGIRTLLQQTAGGDPNASLAYLEAGIAAQFPKGLSATPPKDLRQTRAFQRAREQETLLIDSLEAAGIPLNPRDQSQRWLPILGDYFWVQFREGPVDDWRDAHPAFGEAQPPAQLEAEEYFDDSVPAKYHHTLAISAWIEQLVGGKITRHALMPPWTGPVANLSGQAIRYRNAPNGLTLDSVADLDRAVADTRFLMPMLNDAVAPGARAFDLKGRTIDPMALSSAAAGLFQTLGDKMVDATEGVAGNDSAQPAMALHSMWLEFTFTTPSGTSSSHRRYLLPPRSDYQGDEQALVWPLMTDHVYMPASGRQPLDYLADRYLDTAIQDMDWLNLMFHKAFEPDVGIPVPDDLPVDFPPLTQYWLMDRHPGLDDDVIAYRAVPGLIGLRRGHRDAQTAFVATDIVANAIEHVRLRDQGLESVPRAVLSRGVWDTALESVPGQVLEPDAPIGASTSKVFELARQQGIPIHVLKPGDETTIDARGLDAQAHTFLATDREQGFAIVLPSQVPDGATMAGWWRVHPETGETLGMTGDGYGQDSIEYVLMDTIMTATSLANAVTALKECETKPSMVTKLCCLVEANINNVAGLSFGGILGATVGTAGAAVFEIANTFSSGALMPSANAGCDQLPDTEW